MKKLNHTFKYCPRCATPRPLIEQERRLECRNCDFTFYFNTATAAGAFILCESQLVLCVRAREPGRGLLDVPGGFIEPGETVEAGLRREIYEEINAVVGPLQYLGSAPNDYPYRDVPYKTADLFFIARTDSLMGLKAQDDVVALKVVDPQTVDPLDFAFASTRAGFHMLLKTLGF